MDPEATLTDDDVSLKDAVILAQGIVEGPDNTGVTPVILIVTDRDNPTLNDNIDGLQQAIDNVKKTGIVVGAMNANPATEELWKQLVSSDETFIQMDEGTEYDDDRYARFISQRFCLGMFFFSLFFIKRASLY